MSTTNQYAAPRSQVERADGEDYGQIRVFSTAGRLGRIRYIAYSMGFALLFYLVVLLSSGLFNVLLGTGAEAIGLIVPAAAWIGLMIISFMLTIQRCHDFNTSGWLSLLALIPLVVLVFWFIPGTKGVNRFGGQTPPNSVLVTVAAVMGFAVPVVVGIVAAIAIPAYQGYVERAQQLQLEQQR